MVMDISLISIIAIYTLMIVFFLRMKNQKKRKFTSNHFEEKDEGGDVRINANHSFDLGNSTSFNRWIHLKQIISSFRLGIIFTTFFSLTIFTIYPLLPIKGGALYILPFGGAFLGYYFWSYLNTKLQPVLKKWPLTNIIDLIFVRYKYDKGLAIILALIAMVACLPFIFTYFHLLIKGFWYLLGKQNGDSISLLYRVIVESMLVIFLAIQIFYLGYGDRYGRKESSLNFLLSIHGVVKLMALFILSIVCFMVFQSSSDHSFSLGFKSESELSLFEKIAVLFFFATPFILLPGQSYLFLKYEDKLKEAKWSVWTTLLLMAMALYPISLAMTKLTKVGTSTVLWDQFLLIQDRGGGTFLIIFLFLGMFAATSSFIILNIGVVGNIFSHYILLPFLQWMNTYQGEQKGESKKIFSSYFVHHQFISLLILSLVFTGHIYLTYFNPLLLKLGYGLIDSRTVSIIGEFDRGLLRPALFLLTLLVPPVIVGPLWSKGNRYGAYLSLFMGLLIGGIFELLRFLGNSDFIQFKSSIVTYHLDFYLVIWLLSLSLSTLFYILGSLAFKREDKQDNKMEELYSTIIKLEKEKEAALNGTNVMNRNISSIKIKSNKADDFESHDDPLFLLSFERKIVEANLFLEKWISKLDSEKLMVRVLTDLRLNQPSEEMSPLLLQVTFLQYIERELSFLMGPLLSFHLIKDNFPFKNFQEKVVWQYNRIKFHSHHEESVEKKNSIQTHELRHVTEVENLMKERSIELESQNQKLRYEIEEMKLLEKEWIKTREELIDWVESRTDDLVQSNHVLRKELFSKEILLKEKSELESSFERSQKELNELKRELELSKNDKEMILQQLIQTSKLATLGEIAASVAHELNNPLTGILGMSQTIFSHSDDEALVKDKAQKIIVIGKRMKVLIEHMRVYSRKPQQEDWKKLSLLVPIENSLILFEDQLRKYKIDLKIEGDKETLPEIWGDSNKIESIVQNLISNSRDAFLLLKDRRKFEIRMTLFHKDNSVILAYRDNAGGMPSDVAEKIFEPFFTTKSAEKGTGLGLSVVKSIIDEHKGSVSLDTKLGEGSSFTITFPLDRRGSFEKNLEKSSDDLNSEVPLLTINKPKKQEEKNMEEVKHPVLVIDDEEVIGEVLQDLLSPYFMVTVLSDSTEAVKELKGSKEYSLILTDVNMPGVSGEEIVKISKQFRPFVPVVLMSGHSKDDPEILKLLAAGAVTVLTKPFVDLDQMIEILNSQITSSFSANKIAS